MQPEQKAKLILSAWLMENGFEIWWEQKNTHGFDVFMVSGTGGSKPDMLFRNEFLPGYYVMEVKTGDKSRELMEASKIIGYYNDFVGGKASYSIGGEQITPVEFLIGTTYSPNNRLFKEDVLISDQEASTGRKNAREMNQIPKEEYRRTADFIRHLWASWNMRVRPFGLGALLSENGHPILSVMDSSNYGSRWLQRLVRFPLV